MPILFFALCGLRRAEVAAIRWNRVDLDTGRLAVTTSIEQTDQGTREKPPKSGRTRKVVLPALMSRNYAGTRSGRRSNYCGLGCASRRTLTSVYGRTDSPWPPGKLTAAFRRLIRSSGLPRVRLHDLRHGHATHLLAANTHVKVVSERLGHANIQLTLNTYSHVLPSMQDDAAATIDGALRKALKQTIGSKMVAIRRLAQRFQRQLTINIRVDLGMAGAGDAGEWAQAASGTTRFRPLRLARYRAWSARFSTVAASSFRANAAMPIEIVTSMLRAPCWIGNGSLAICRRSRSATMVATAMSVSGMITTNSSPP